MVQYDDVKATSKCPPPYTQETQALWVNGYQDNVQVAKNLRATNWYQSTPEHQYKDSLGEAVYRLFSQNYFSDYAAFASTAYAKKLTKPPDYLSCEDIHKWVTQLSAHCFLICFVATSTIGWAAMVICRKFPWLHSIQYSGFTIGAFSLFLPEQF